MPVDDDGDDLAALEASPPSSPYRQDGEPEGPAAVAAAGRARMQQQRGDWYAAQQRARAVPAVAVTPLFVSGGALHSTSTKNKEVILPPTLTRAADTREGDAATGAEESPQLTEPQGSKVKPSDVGEEAVGDAAPFLPSARICSRAVTEFSHLAVQKDGKTMSVLCLPWLYQKLHKDVLLLGRGDHADIHTDHPSCSRAHCEIRRVYLPDGSVSYTLEDLNSAHGTLVNGGKIAPRKPTVLDDDDEVQVGFSQRLYTFKKGDDKLGLQRSEAPSLAAVPVPPPPPPDDGGDAAAKPSFLQKHIERRARMGGFSRGRGGGYYSGDRQRFHQGGGRDAGDAGGEPWGREGEDAMGRSYEGRGGGYHPEGGGREGSSGVPYNHGRAGAPDSRYDNGDRDGGPMRRERGGWQRSPYTPGASRRGGEGYSAGGGHSAFTGANATPLGGSWGSAGRYGGDMPEEGRDYPPVSPAAGGSSYSPVPQLGGGPYQTSTPLAGGGLYEASMTEAGGGLYEASMTEAGGGPYAAAMQPPSLPVAEPNPPAKTTFAKADRVYVYHICLKFVGALNILGQPEVATLRDGKTPMQRTREQARQYLEQARQLLQEQPEHFGDYAEELSDCSSYTRRGDVGWLRSNGMLESGEQLFPPLMAAGALALEVGQLSPVLESHMGFHLFLRTA